MAVKTITINGQLVSVREEDTILLAAREAGIAIPTLCYLPGVSAHGGCRVCLVEIGGSNRLQAACVTRVTEGMDVHTDTPKLRIPPHDRGVAVRRGTTPARVCRQWQLRVANPGNRDRMDHERFEYQSPAAA